MQGALIMALLMGCGDKDSGADGDSGSGISGGSAADVAGDWEGVCAFPDTDINIDMVLSQTDRDLTGGVDIYFEQDGKLSEHDGSITGTVTLDAIALDMVFADYGTLAVAADYSADDNAGERIIGSCTDPGGSTGNLALAR